MKSTFISIFILLIGLESTSQIWLRNSVTRKEIIADEGVVISVQAKIADVPKFTMEWDYWANVTWVTIIKTSHMTSNSYTYDGSAIDIPCYAMLHYTLTITSPNYQTLTISNDGTNSATFVECPETLVSIRGDQRNNSSVKDILDKLNNGAPYIVLGDVYLVPKKEVIEGNLNITNKESEKSKDKYTNELGLLTTKSIADGLGLSEGEVIKLITTNQLKGKKIGDKYFVRKEDFDAFMKK